MDSSPSTTPLESIVVPKHHARYARAWFLHQDADLSDESRLILEHEMDDAQNNFSWDEFQKFKATLPGYIEHWDGIKEEMLSKLQEHFSA